MRRADQPPPDEQPTGGSEQPGTVAAIARVASDAVIKASAGLQVTEAIAQRAGLTKRNGKLRVRGLWKAAVHPVGTARTVLDATAEELRSRRVADGSGSKG